MEEFERLLRANYGPLERLVKFKMDGPPDGEDVLQEVCVTALEKFHHLRDTEKFKPWIFQIARNKIRDYYRAKAPEAVPLEDVAPWLAAEETEHTVRETLAALPPRDRKILELSGLYGLTGQEIAQELDIPLGTVKSRMYAARGRFRAIYPQEEKGATCMKKLPDIMPSFTIIPSEKAPFPVKWEELMGWFLVPREGETLKWAMYDFPERKKTMYVDMAAVGKAKIHGIEGVRIRCVEHDPVPSEQNGEKKDVERFLVAQKTLTHTRILAEHHTAPDGTQEYYTFLDGDDFLKNWGFGPDNIGNPIHITQRADIVQVGDQVTVKETDWPLDVTGRYTVTIGDKTFDTICVWDVGCYEMGGASQQFLDENGRTILWRRFAPNDFALDHFGAPWTERLPENERVTINGKIYVHWYDCITDYILSV